MMTTHRFAKGLSLAIAAFLVMASVASAQFTLNVSFAAGNGQSGNMFDVSATNPVNITSFDVHQADVTTTVTYEVYHMTNRMSYVGSETVAANWTLLGTASVVGAGLGVPTPLNLGLNFNMTPGETIGFYVTAVVGTVQYTNGTVVGGPWASDANISVFEGVGKSYPFGGTFTPRNFNGQIHYNLAGSGVADDLACASVDSPADAASCAVSSNAEAVSFTVANYGTNTINLGTSFSAALVLDGTTIATENFTFLTSALAQFASEQFTFAATLDLSGGGSHTIDVVTVYGPDLDNSNDTASLSVNAGAADDLALASIDGPADAVGCNTLGSTETVPFTVTNMGANSILIGSAFTASLTHNGTLIATENFVVTAADILCGASDSFTFAATLNMSTGGTQTVDVALTYPGDVQPANDSGTLSVNASGAGGAFVTTYPYTEDFSTFGAAGVSATGPLTGGWQQDPNDGTGTIGDWWFGTSTSSSLSGPETNGLGDHTTGTGRFAHIEDSGTANPVINLWTPCFDLSGLTSPQARVWVHSHHFNGGAHFNPVHIDLLTPGGVVSSVASVLADTGDMWVAVNFSLTPYAGQVIQVQIRGDNSAGLQFCDSAIDDFTVYEPVVLNGQVPQPGVATLDINGAINGNTASVASGQNGPYMANVNQNGVLNFTMSGEANAGIVLVGGPLNVQVATYPGFGQFDIGTLPLSGTGVPGGLFLWADGVTAPVVGVNQFFVLSPSGTSTLGVSVPTLPLGVFTTFQCINTHSTLIIGFSNAVEITVIP